MTDREFLGKIYFLLQHESRATVICDQLEDMLAERLKQPEQWEQLYSGMGNPFKRHEVPVEQEPVAWMDKFGNVFPLGAQRGPKYLNEPMKPLYTTPQRREWVGLTRDEVLDIEETHPLAFYRAIEAKLKEKNNG
jgi:hypothetical protein